MCLLYLVSGSVAIWLTSFTSTIVLRMSFYLDIYIGSYKHVFHSWGIVAIVTCPLKIENIIRSVRSLSVRLQSRVSSYTYSFHLFGVPGKLFFKLIILQKSLFIANPF